MKKDLKQILGKFFRKEHLVFLKFAHEHRISIKPSHRYIGIIFITFAYFLLANSTIFFEEVSEKIPIFQIFFLQFLIVSLVFAILLGVKGKQAFKPKEPVLVFVRGSVAMLTYYSYFASKIWINVVDNSLLFSIDALIIPIFMYFFFDVRIVKSAIIGLIIGFIGISSVNIFDLEFSSWGGMIGLTSGLGLAFIVVITSYMVKNDSPLVIAFYQAIIGLATSFIPMVFNEWKSLDFIALTSIVCQALFFATALFLFLDAFYYTEPYIIGALGYTLTVFIIILEAIILRTVINLHSLIGTILVCGGGLIVIASSYLNDKKEKKKS